MERTFPFSLFNFPPLRLDIDIYDQYGIVLSFSYAL